MSLKLQKATSEKAIMSIPSKGVRDGDIAENDNILHLPPLLAKGQTISELNNNGEWKFINNVYSRYIDVGDGHLAIMAIRDIEHGAYVAKAPTTRPEKRKLWLMVR